MQCGAAGSASARAGGDVSHKVIHSPPALPAAAALCAIIRPRLKNLSPHAAGAFFVEKTVLSIIQAAGWPIWPLILCSILALAFVIERFVKLQKERVLGTGDLLGEAIGVSRNAVPSPDVVNQLADSSSLGEVLAAGWRAINQNPRCTPDDMRAAMESAGRAVRHKLERYLPALGTIASAAPLLGLLGTVIGMIEIFGSQAGTGAVTGGDPAMLAHGISTALYNTAFGLIVAIPSLIFWRYFRTRVEGYTLTMELAAERFAHHLDRLCPAANGTGARS